MKFMTLITLFALFGCALAQAPQQMPDANIDSATKQRVIDNVLKALNAQYVFPKVAKQMEDAVRGRIAKGEYEKMTSSREFADKLTTDLQAVSHDKHLRVRYRAEKIPVRQPDVAPTPADIEENKQFIASINGGFEKVERLAGNIGYLKFDGFMSPGDAGDIAANAMNFLSNTDAMIIDLRENGGGDPAMVQLICSYFFDGGVHLNDLYFRPTDETMQFWTLGYVPGKKYLEKDVYILTSSHTFSGAEEFCYNMQTQKRATIVGETTGGGANPGHFERLDDHFGAFVPTGRAINPITKTNWEGVGVKPEIATEAKDALTRAQLEASKKLAAKTKNPDLKRELEESIAKLQKG